MGFLEEKGISVPVPPRVFPFPVHYLSPTRTTSSTFEYTHSVLSQYRKVEVRVYGASNASAKIYVNGKELLVAVTNITTRYVRGATTTSGVAIPDDAALFLPFDVEVSSTRYVSQNLKSGYIYSSLTLSRCFRGVYEGDAVRSILVEHNGSVEGTIEVVGLERTLPDLYLVADSFSLRRIKWAFDGEVFARPRVFAAREWVLVLAENASFLYNVLTEEVVDVFAPAGFYLSGKDCFYFVDYRKNLYKIAPPFSFSLAGALDFLPDASVNGRTRAFVRFKRGKVVLENVNYLFSCDLDTSYTLTVSGQTFTGKLSPKGQLIAYFLKSSSIEVLYADESGFAVAFVTPSIPPQVTVKSLDDVYDANWFEDARIVEELPIQQETPGTGFKALGYCGNYYLAAVEGSKVNLYWLLPQNFAIASSWTSVDLPTLLEQEGVTFEVERLDGTVELCRSKAFIFPSKTALQFRSVFDMLPTIEDVRAVLGNSINSFRIIRGPYYRGGINWAQVLADRYPGVSVTEADTPVSLAGVLNILTPGCVFRVGGSDVHYNFTCLIPFTALVITDSSASNAVFDFHATLVHIVNSGSSNFLDGCLVLGGRSFTAGDYTMTLSSSNVQDVVEARNLEALVFPSTPFQTPDSRNRAVDVVEVEKVDFEERPVVGRRYRVVVTKGGGYVVSNLRDVQVVTDVLLPTTLRKGKVRFQNGMEGVVVEAPSGARYILVRNVQLAPKQTVSFVPVAVEETQEEASCVLENAFYAFESDLYDLKKERTWTCAGSFALSKDGLTFSGELSKELQSVGTLRMELRAGVCEVRVDDALIGYVIGNAFYWAI